MSFKFEVFKLKRAIAKQGKQYTFYSYGVNSFGEPSTEKTILKTFQSLYHEQNGYISENVNNETRTTSKKIPYLMTEFQNIGTDSNEIKNGCETEIDGIKYKVTGVTNLANLSLIADISLEVINE